MLEGRLSRMVPVAIVVACLTLSVAVPLQGRNDDKVEEDLARARGAADGAPVQLDWRPLAFLPYDRLYAFGTAATDEGVRRRLGFAWGEGVAVIPPRRGEIILVFVAKRRVAAWTRVQGKTVDASCLAALRSLRRRDALLQAVRPAAGGPPVLAPVAPVPGRRQQRRLERCLANRGLP